VNNLPKVATQWNSGTTRESNPGPSALTTKPLNLLHCHCLYVLRLLVLLTCVDVELIAILVCKSLLFFNYLRELQLDAELFERSSSYVVVFVLDHYSVL